MVYFFFFKIIEALHILYLVVQIQESINRDLHVILLLVKKIVEHP